jgi:large subunit ribosomal protein L3
MAPKSLVTRKLGMTSTISEDGVVKAVTLLGVSEHTVIQKKTVEIDGYNALQVGIENGKNLGKTILGHVKKSKAMPKIIREIRITKNNESELNVGDTFNTDVFSVGDKVSATGLNKGKGWAGTIKRHNFHRGRKTHGGRSYRRPGSIGSMYPQHIFKGKKMAGQMGHVQVTGVYGAVPGPRKGIIVLKGQK